MPLVAPAMDQLSILGVLQRKLAHHRETIGIAPGRIDRERVRVGVPATRRMDQCGVDPGRVHLGQNLFGGEFLDLAVQA